MSAYIVNRDHIRYLVSAAMNLGPGRPCFRWWYLGRSHELRCGDHERAAEVAAMLWDENARSVNHRYCDTDDEPTPDYGRHEPWRGHVEPVQLLKAIRCYEYQSCETADYGETEAHAFMEALTLHAISRLDGYDDAEWGPPRHEYPARMDVV